MSLFITTSSVKETHKDSTYIFLTSAQNERVLKKNKDQKQKLKVARKVENHRKIRFVLRILVEIQIKVVWIHNGRFSKLLI